MTALKEHTFKEVYAGGHHAVLCNGEWHLWVTSGPCQPYGRFIREGKCDCARWQRDDPFAPYTP